MGSLMLPSGGDGPVKRKYGSMKNPEEVKQEAVQYLREYYDAKKRCDFIYVFIYYHLLFLHFVPFVLYVPVKLL